MPKTSNVTQHFQVTMICQTDHMMQVHLNISFYFCFKIKKIRNLNLGKQISCRFRKHRQNLAKENTIHRHHLLSGTQRKLTNSNVFLH